MTSLYIQFYIHDTHFLLKTLQNMKMFSWHK